MSILDIWNRVKRLFCRAKSDNLEPDPIRDLVVRECCRTGKVVIGTIEDGKLTIKYLDRIEDKYLDRIEDGNE